MAPVYKFALIQLKPKPVALEENFSRAAAKIRDAAGQGAHLAVLPEYHLTGWVPGHPDFLAATEKSAAYLERYQQLARELNISIVPGTICEVHPGREESGDGAAAAAAVEIRNMAYFVAAGSGDVVGSYQKKNLWHPERAHLTSSGGTAHDVFDTPLTWDDGGEGGEKRPVRAGLLVCWDLAFPEAFRELVAGGAEVVVVPSCWLLSDVDERAKRINPLSEKVFLESVTVARACESGVCVVFVNEGGMSRVAMPILGTVEGSETDAVGEGSGEGVDGEVVMRVVDVDLGILKVAEENYGVRRDMLGEGWHYAHTLMRGT